MSNQQQPNDPFAALREAMLDFGIALGAMMDDAIERLEPGHKARKLAALDAFVAECERIKRQFGTESTRR